jgi:hypothetical protein
MITEKETIVHQPGEAAVIQALGGQCRRVNPTDFVFAGDHSAALEAYRTNQPIPCKYLLAAIKQLKFRQKMARQHHDNELARGSSRALYGDAPLRPEAC